MYRCTDCSKKYQAKPDYCDCGNNAFTQEVVSTASIQPGQADAPKTFFEQYPSIKQFIDSVDVLSGTIFGLCIILSILLWNFIGAWEPPADTAATPQETETSSAQNQNIPDINSLWNTTPPKAPEVKQDAPVLPTEQPAEEHNIPDAQSILPLLSPQSKTLQSKPEPVTPKPEPVAPKPHHTLLNQDLSSMSPAMKNYTSGLRQSLFSQWAVGSVEGEGRCEVEFAVSKSGKLLGRKFSKQSDNDSLNNSVYDMLMSSPQYSAPPADYNGEKIRLSFYFNHGYYEVNYPKY